MGNPQTGVFATEVPNARSSAITGLPTTAVGLVLRTGRGWVNKPIRVNDTGKYRRIFGNPTPNNFSYQSIDGLFSTAGANSNGVNTKVDVYVVRVLGSSGGANTKAALNVTAAAGGAASAGSLGGSGFPVIVADGMTFLGKVDGGGTLTATINAKPATITGSAATYAAVTANHKLILTIAGKTRTITFTGAENSQATFFNTINTLGITVNASNAAGQTKLTTNQIGSGATGTVSNSSDADVLASLGLTGGAAFTNAGPNNVADGNINGMTALELATIFNGVFVGSTSSAPTATTFLWQSNTTGTSSSVQLTSGTGVSSITGFDTAVHSGTNAGGALSVMSVTAVGEGAEYNNDYVVWSQQTTFIGGISSNVVAGSIAQISLTAAVIARIAVGDTISITDGTTSQTIRGYIARINNGNTAVFVTAATLSGGGLTSANARVSLETFSMQAFYAGIKVRDESGLRMSPLSQNYFVNRLNNGDDEQQYAISDLGAAVTADNRPVNVISTGDYLTGGADATNFADADYIGSNSAPKTGLYALDQIKRVRRISIPGVTGITTGAVSSAIIDYCDKRGDCRAVLAFPPNSTPSQMVTFRNGLGGSSYGSIYGPWIKVLDPLTGAYINMPPEGWVLGMNGRCNVRRGIAKAPAGSVDGVIQAAIDVERKLDDDDVALLNTYNINRISIENNVVCVMLARTLQDSGGNSQIHARDTLIYLRTSIRLGTQFIYEEPNTAATRKLNKDTIDNFLETEWKRGTLDGSQPTNVPSSTSGVIPTTGDSNLKQFAFTVVCDASNNPPSTVNANEMITEISVQIPKVVERSFIFIKDGVNA